MKRRKHEPFAATTFLSIYFEIYTRDLKLAGSVALSTLQNTLLSRVHGQAYKQTKSVNNRKTVKTVMTLTWYRHVSYDTGHDHPS
jgi:hypothetical protein